MGVWDKFLVFVIALLCSSTAVSTAPVITCDGANCSDGIETYRCASKGKVCCSGPADKSQVFGLREGFKCCQGSGKLYDESREICDNGEIRQRGPNEFSCGNGAYNAATQVCCHDQIYDKVLGAECCRNQYLLDPNESCCGGIKFLKSEQVCCERPHVAPDNRHYDLFDIPYGKCCLDEPYDPLTKSCQLGTDGVFTLRDEVGSNIHQCGFLNPQMYDNTTHGCCMGSTPTVYDTGTQICHHAFIYNKTEPEQNDGCFEFDNDGNILRATMYKSDDRTVCIEGQVIYLGPLEKKCGREVYNTSEDLCCKDKVYRGAGLVGQVCCDGGTNFYYPDREVCCANEVSRKMARNSGAICCHKTPYNPKTHDCEGGVVTKPECPDIKSRCNVTLEKINAIKRKVYIYFGSTKSSQEKGRGKRRYKEWIIDQVRSFKVKKGKVTLVPVKSKGSVAIRSKKCECPELLEVGLQYIFVTSAPIKRGKLSMQGGKAPGFIVPLREAEKIGLLFQGLVEDHST